MGRRTLLLVLISALAFGGYAPSGHAENSDCTWLAGDFHVHTVYSHDSFGGPQYDDEDETKDFYTLGWTPTEEALIAASRGLDFLTITDHNNVRSQSDPGWQTFSDLGVIPVPGYENSIGGHAQMLGATKVYDNSHGVEGIARDIRADGGAIQINHPGDGKWETSLDGDLLYPDFVPDSLEVWNIGPWVYEPPFPATEDHEYPLRLYNRFLDRGDQIAATGGSDSHWRSTTAAQGPGQPTTWVCAMENTWQGVVDGVKAGRTSISHQPPNLGGPRVNIHKDENGDSLAGTVVGETLAPETEVLVNVINAPGAQVRLIGDGGQVLDEYQVSDADLAHAITPPAEVTWMRAEVFYPDAAEVRGGLDMACRQIAYDGHDAHNYCHGRLAMVALSSPVYFLDPTTNLTYNGGWSAPEGSQVILTATLIDSKERPITGAPVTFSFQGNDYRGTTDHTGRVSVSAPAAGPPGYYTTHADFAGDDHHDASHAVANVEVTAGS